MNNRKVSLEEKEKYIRELTILKLKKNYKHISEGEYKCKLYELCENYTFSDYEETLSRQAYVGIVRIIDEALEEGTELLFQQEIKTYFAATEIQKNCDVVILGQNVIDVIRIIPLNENFIYALEDVDSRLMALGAVNKFLPSILGNYVRIIVIQPNLMGRSIHETTIDSFLHEFDYSLLWC